VQEMALAGNARLAGLRGADQSTVLMVGLFDERPSWCSVACVVGLAGSMTDSSDSAHCQQRSLPCRYALQLEASLMKFRNDLAIGGNVSAQTNVTPQTQVQPPDPRL
jgi:hypothetical protein